MDELKRVLEELLAVQVVDIALRLEARNNRAGDMLPETFLREAVGLVRKHREDILAALHTSDPGAEEEAELKPGEKANLDAAKKMSKKQKRYDLQKGLF